MIGVKTRWQFQTKLNLWGVSKLSSLRCLGLGECMSPIYISKAFQVKHYLKTQLPEKGSYAGKGTEKYKDNQQKSGNECAVKRLERPG